MKNHPPANGISVNQVMEAYALEAVDHAKHSFGIELDFSVVSVGRVEQILATLHDRLPKGVPEEVAHGPSEEALGEMVKMYGGYVGEVLRRAGGGDWYFDDEVTPGRRAIGLRKEGRKVWPPTQVQKRVVDGGAENVWVYFQAILDETW